MGYDPSQFDSKVSKEFICSICYDVMDNPLTVTLCEHVYCSKCIKQWLDKHPENAYCPLDRSGPLSLDQLRPPLRSFRNLLNSLNIRCCFEDCGQYVQLQDYEEHCIACIHNPVNQAKEFNCPKYCGAIIRLQDKHDCVAYLKKQVKQAITEKINDRSKISDELTRLKEENNRLVEENRKIVNEFREKEKQNEDIILNLNKEIETQKSLKENFSQQLFRLERIVKSQNSSDLERSSARSSRSSADSSFEFNDKLNAGVRLIKTEMLLDIDHIDTNGMLLCKQSSQNSNSTFYDDSQTPPQSPKNVQTLTKLQPSSIGRSASNLAGSRSNLAERALAFMPNIIPKPKLPLATANGLNIAQHVINNQKMKPETVIRTYGKSDKIARILSHFNREHFFQSKELHKPISLGKGAHSFSLLYEIKLLEFVEPYLTQDSCILDVGSGHGYLACCLTQLCRRVVGVEHINELMNKSREIVRHHYSGLFEAKQLHFVSSDGRLGHSKYAPYDLILIEPMVKRVPDSLLKQLKPNTGSLIVVIKGSDPSRLQLVRITVNEQQQQNRQILLDDQPFLEQNNRDQLVDRKTQDNVRTEIFNRIKMLK